MTLDIPHMIVTVVIVFAVVWALNNSTALSNMSKGRRALITFAILFIAIFILNLVWPYGSGI